MRIIVRCVLALSVLSYVATAVAAVTVSVNGSNHTIPQTNEKGWGANVTAWIQAISANTLQPSGGTFTLTAEVNTGATYGFKVPYIKTATTLPSSVGVLRLAEADSIGWRNNANDGNLLLAVDNSDNLTFNGTALQESGDYITALTGDVSAAGPGSATATITALDATKIADGTVTSTEFQYINTLSSNAQTQISAKAPSADPTFTGAAGFADGLIGTPSITFSGDLDNGLYRIGANNYGLVAGGYKGIDIVKSTGNFANVAFGGGSASTSDIFGFVLNRDNSTGQAFAVQNVQGGSGAFSRVYLVNDSGGTHTGDISLHPAAQTLAAYQSRMAMHANGSSTAGISFVANGGGGDDVRFYHNGGAAGNESVRLNADYSLQFMQQISTPATPSSNSVKLYQKSDDKLYLLNDAGVESQVGAAGGSSGINMLSAYNRDAESGTTYWSETGGGTLATNTTAANVGNGAASFSFDASADTDYAISDARTIPSGLFGANCELKLRYKGFDANITAQVHDGMSVVASQVLAAQTTYTPLQIFFPCPSSGTLAVKLLAGADAAIGYWDEVHLGEAIDLFDYGGAIDYGTEAWTDSWGNATSSVKLLRVGNRMFAEGTVTVTGAGTTNFDVTIPAAYTASSFYSFASGEIRTVGLATFYSSAPAVFPGVASLTSATNIRLAHTNTGAVTNLTSTVPFTWANGHKMTWKASWEVSGWSTTPAAALTNSNADTDWTAWTPTGSWSANTTYTGFKRKDGDQGCYQVKVATSGAPTSATLTINMPSGEVIDTAKLSNTVTLMSALPSLGYVVDSGARVNPVAVLYESSSVVRPINNAGGVGSNITQAVPITFGASDYVDLNWCAPIVGWTRNMSAPVLVGSVTSANTGALRTEYAKLNCDAGSTIVSQSGTTSTAFASIGNASSGACAVAFAAGAFSSAPVCTAGVTACVGGCVILTSVTSATAMTFSCITDTGAAGTSCDANVICVGPK